MQTNVPARKITHNGQVNRKKTQTVVIFYEVYYRPHSHFWKAWVLKQFKTCLFDCFKMFLENVGIPIIVLKNILDNYFFRHCFWRSAKDFNTGSVVKSFPSSEKLECYHLRNYSICLEFRDYNDTNLSGRLRDVLNNWLERVDFRQKSFVRDMQNPAYNGVSLPFQCTKKCRLIYFPIDNFSYLISAPNLFIVCIAFIPINW